jgi:hypothetical protein
VGSHEHWRRRFAPHLRERHGDLHPCGGAQGRRGAQQAAHARRLRDARGSPAGRRGAPARLPAVCARQDARPRERHQEGLPAPPAARAARPRLCGEARCGSPARAPGALALAACRRRGRVPRGEARALSGQADTAAALTKVVGCRRWQSPGTALFRRRPPRPSRSGGRRSSSPAWRLWPWWPASALPSPATTRWVGCGSPCFNRGGVRGWNQVRGDAGGVAVRDGGLASRRLPAWGRWRALCRRAPRPTPRWRQLPLSLLPVRAYRGWRAARSTQHAAAGDGPFAGVSRQSSLPGLAVSAARTMATSLAVPSACSCCTRSLLSLCPLASRRAPLLSTG